MDLRAIWTIGLYTVGEWLPTLFSKELRISKAYSVDWSSRMSSYDDTGLVQSVKAMAWGQHAIIQIYVNLITVSFIWGQLMWDT